MNHSAVSALKPIHCFELTADFPFPLSQNDCAVHASTPVGETQQIQAQVVWDSPWFPIQTPPLAFVDGGK